MGKKKEKNKTTLEVLGFIVAVLVLVATVAGVLLTRKQVTADISVLNTRDYSFAQNTSGDREQVVCSYSIRVDNGGGAATSIVGYDVTVSAFDTSDTRSNDRSSKVEGSLLFDELIFNSALFYQPPDPTILSFPYKIEGYDTKDIYVGLSVSSYYPIHSDPPESLPENFSWVRAKFTLHLSSGETVKTTEVRCGAVER